MFALLGCVLAAEDIQVLATKELANKQVVNGRDAVIKYAVYNIGSTYVAVELVLVIVELCSTFDYFDVGRC